MQFSHYADLPAALAKDVIEQSGNKRIGDDEE